MKIFLALLLLCSPACGDDLAAPDAALPSCAALGCPGPLLCSSKDGACTCRGQACAMTAAPDAGAD